MQENRTTYKKPNPTKFSAKDGTLLTGYTNQDHICLVKLGKYKYNSIGFMLIAGYDYYVPL